MASFREVLKERRKEGSGIISSLGSAAAGTTKEALDIRNALFKTGSLLNALFPKVKGYSAIDRAPKAKTSPTSLMSDAGSILVNEKLNVISKNTEISAKNSIVLPKMAYDTNIMRLNLTRLASALTGKASRGPDVFFAAAKERENIYEKQFEKTRSPTAITKPETKDKGFFSTLLGFISGFLGEGILSLLIKGGLIVGLLTTLGKYFTDSEFRDKVNDIVDKAMKTIFGEDVWQNLINGVLGVGLAVAGLQFAIAAFTTSLAALNPAVLVAGIIAAGSAALINVVFGKGGKLDQWMAEKGPKPMGTMGRGELTVPEEDLAGRPGLFDMKRSRSAYDARKKRIQENLERGAEYTSEEVDRIKKAYGIDVPSSQIKKTETPSTPTPAQSSQETNGQIEQILATIKQKESGGDYTKANPTSSASGAYQYIDSTWQALTKKYGIGTEYSRAKDAPAEIQDEIARRDVQDILKRVGGDISKVPNVWYTGNAEGKMTEKQLAANKGLTSEMYQQDWMKRFAKISGGAPQVALAPNAPKTSSVSSSSLALADSRMAMRSSQPIVINAPTNNVQQGSMGGGVSMPVNVVDTDFMKYLVGRTITI